MRRVELIGLALIFMSVSSCSVYQATDSPSPSVPSSSSPQVTAQESRNRELPSSSLDEEPKTGAPAKRDSAKEDSASLPKIERASSEYFSKARRLLMAVGATQIVEPEFGYRSAFASASWQDGSRIQLYLADQLILGDQQPGPVTRINGVRHRSLDGGLLRRCGAYWIDFTVYPGPDAGRPVSKGLTKELALAISESTACNTIE